MCAKDYGLEMSSQIGGIIQSTKELHNLLLYDIVTKQNDAISIMIRLLWLSFD